MSEDVILALYPPPPPYYKYFTASNFEKFAEWKNTPEPRDDSALLQELRLQIPPEIPTTDQYRGYGSVWSLETKLPPLKDLGWTQLYQEEDENITSKTKIEELHKLLDSLLLNFLELTASVSVEPLKFYVKIEHLKLILINFNHLLNTYRPHQTRESLIMLLQSQLEGKRKEIAEIDATTAAVKEKIAALVQEQDFKLSRAESPESEEGPDPKLEKLRELLGQ